MANANNGKAKRPSPKNTRKSAPKKQMNTGARKQLAAIVLFSVSLLLLCIVFINGGGLWGMSKSLLFGLFGFCAFVCPFLLIYVAIMAAMDKSMQRVGFKIAEALTLLFLISSAIHIFTFDGTVSFMQDIADAYNHYRIDESMLGSGAVGAFFGGLILLMTGSSKAAAIAIVLILIFLCFMLMTGMTLIRLLRTFWKPVQKQGSTRAKSLSKFRRTMKKKKRKSRNLTPMWI